ncbi:MAG: hypothetical protein LBE22_05530 [Azoarcus sp.]|jgi:hypothetical protein|nr:hypothetical protein [Azoarcus sp.]
MNNKKPWLIFISSVAILTGCGDSGSKFEGKWSCNTQYGKLSLSIQNKGENNFIIEYFEGGHLDETWKATYKDGALVLSGASTPLSIDKKSGNLVGYPFCEMSRDK